MLFCLVLIKLRCAARTEWQLNLFLQNVNTEDFDGEVIFMVDRSGSMQERITSLIDVMNVFLMNLPQKCSFNIASSGSRFSWLWPFSQAYKQEDLDTAHYYRKAKHTCQSSVRSVVG
jgi:hypothetical protein